VILTRYTKSPTDLPLLTAELRLLVRAAAAAAASVPAGTPPASYRIHLAAANAAGAPEARGHAEQPHPASMVTGAPPPIKAPTRSECVEVNGEDGGSSAMAHDTYWSCTFHADWTCTNRETVARGTGC